MEVCIYYIFFYAQADLGWTYYLKKKKQTYLESLIESFPWCQGQ